LDYLNLSKNSIYAVIAFSSLYHSFNNVKDFVQSLWYEGKANEYVLLIRNGQLIKSGIGISG